MSETQPETAQVFEIQRIYLKDASFESPNVPAVFTKPFDPDSSIELNTASRKLGDKIFEVVLNITLTVKTGEDIAYLVEIKKAGIFTIDGFSDEQLGHLLGAYCPNVLYPFARETISDMIVRGGFPQMLIAPVNFDLLYAQHLAEQAGGEPAPAQH